METASAQAFLAAKTAARIRGLVLPGSDLMRLGVRLNPITAVFPPLLVNSELVALAHHAAEKLPRAAELGWPRFHVVKAAHCGSRLAEAVDAGVLNQARAIAHERETLLLARSCDKKVVAALTHVVDHAEHLVLLEREGLVVDSIMTVCLLHVVLLEVTGQQAGDPFNGCEWEASSQAGSTAAHHEHAVVVPAQRMFADNKTGAIWTNKFLNNFNFSFVSLKISIGYQSSPLQIRRTEPTNNIMQCNQAIQLSILKLCNRRIAFSNFRELQHSYYYASNCHFRRYRPCCSLERRDHSTLVSNSFWRGLHQAVRQGNGNHAEEIVNKFIQDYYRLTAASSSSLPHIPTFDNEQNFHRRSSNSQQQQQQQECDNICHDNNINGRKSVNNNSGDVTFHLDSRIFSLVLQAWKKGCASLHSALRAHNLLVEMVALADQDLCDPPIVDDYAAVLECWYQASTLDDCKEENGKNQRIINNSKKKENGSNSLTLVLQHAEELWNQMKERQRQETARNKTACFIIDENSYELFTSLLAKDGRAKQAEHILQDAVLQLRRREHWGDNNNSIHARDDHPLVSLNMCRAVLEAHARSTKTKASESAETFLQKMRTDPSLPNPDVGSYNLVLENIFTSFGHQSGVAIADRMEEFIIQMKEDRVQPNLTSYQYCIDSLARLGEAIRAETLLASLVKDYFLQYDADLKPTIKPFQSVLWAYSKARDIPDAAERAESVLNNMKELSTLLDTFPTVWSYNIVMKCWARSKTPSSATSRTIALYEQLCQPSSSPGNDGDTDKDGNEGEENFSEDSDYIYAIHSNANLKPDITSINTVLNVLSINESAIRTEDLLWKFYERHIQDPQMNPCPDKISFSTAIMAWSKTTDPNAPYRAKNLLKRMIELYENGKNINFKPDIMIYTIVMQCWVKSKKSKAPEEAESMLRQLQTCERDGDTNMALDTACWNSAIAAWASAGNGERAEALFLEMIDNHQMNPKNASPSAITLTNVLNAWAKTRSPLASDRAVALLEKMEQYYTSKVLNVKPNAINYSVVLDCLAYAKKKSAAEYAESMLRKMATSDDPHLHPNVASYNSVIKAWSYARDPNSAAKITNILRDLFGKNLCSFYTKFCTGDLPFSKILDFFLFLISSFS